MNLPSLLASPGFGILFKWTVLLTLGWAAHGLLRHWHARWRVILWRGIFCLGLLLPLLQWMEFPGVKIRIRSVLVSARDTTIIVGPNETVSPTQATTLAAPQAQPRAEEPVSMHASSLPLLTPPNNLGWTAFMIAIWASGCLCGAARLFRLQAQLAGLRKAAHQPSTGLLKLATQIQNRLNLQREIGVRISDAVASPFVCGVLKPTIILPQALTQQLSAGELSALLSHELAHLRQHDLVWCVAWRWMKAVCWFHPLVWKAPAAHNLACEQEADRLASLQLPDQDSYAQLLARLALRVLALPPVETKLTLNGSSQIAQRLRHLGQKGMRAWNWRYAVAAFSLVGLLFIATAGCGFTKFSPNGSTKTEFKELLVLVQDQDGKPIEGAKVLPTGFRVKGIHGADAYGWNKKLFGPAETAVTDQAGKAHVKYPVESIPEEREYTGKLILSVSHPEYASVFIQSYSVDSPEEPIKLTRGIHLEVSGYFGSDHQAVTDLIPNLTEGVPPEAWQKMDNGVIAFNKLSPGGHLLQLMGRRPSGETVYSDTMAFTAETGKRIHFALEMKPGIRLEGRLDDHVPRPVKLMRVMIDIVPRNIRC